MTKLDNLINPQVMGEYIEQKLIKNIKLTPLAVVGTELQGRAGNTISLPSWVYIGDANDLAEGDADVPVLLDASMREVTVKKASKAVSITDEAMLSGYGNPIDEIGKQLLMAMTSKIENDCYTALGGATLTISRPITKDGIADAQVLFGEDLDEEMWLFVNPTEYAEVRKHPAFYYVNGQVLTIGGTVGFINNCAVVVASRVPSGTAFIVKRGALGIELKRGVNSEADRDILRKVNTYAVDQHYVAYLRDESKVVKITVTAESGTFGAAQKASK